MFQNKFQELPNKFNKNKMINSNSNLNKSVQQHTYSLSKDLSLNNLEDIYHNVVLKQDFYGDDYGADWDIIPYQQMAHIITSLFSPQWHLDIGCGKGLLVQAMRKLKNNSYGIDFSEALIGLANQSIQKYLTVVTAESWLKKTSIKKVDLITFTEVFEHLPVSTLEQNLKYLRESYNGRLLLTIPSFGLDATFKLGIKVNNDNPEWNRDMMYNIPFKNIVLQDGLPHHGHITLASYRWWSEFLLFHGYSRNRDLEVLCSEKFNDILTKYNWHPYILNKTPKADELTKSIETGSSLGCGWHHYENIKGRWTDGFARLYFVESNLKANRLILNVSPPEINYIQECNLIITIDNLVKTNSYRFIWVQRFSSFPTEIEVRGLKTNMTINLVEIPQEDQNDAIYSNCWRINIISPNFCPNDYGLSSDLRRLGIFIDSLELL
ncbi:bifunctional 2-polyprenyl-6-hydroxyphenol methylase/3-demethylubiquinol 3-O-methyltransferase UbiG [Pleurocapsa sp. PCC 7319]|uniref:class I SAM-dependent methyltransferase n=1 Tax=Pleurocapsa sp. PCC 7319 TaxID=118161 RepID=UPI00037ECF72|nr:methyltransferase domain-containing protein [Pleurocapsa sp. PCC 7319]